jgi:hypothetical protein
MTVTTKVIIFWNMTSFSLLELYPGVEANWFSLPRDLFRVYYVLNAVQQVYTKSPMFLK